MRTDNNRFRADEIHIAGGSGEVIGRRNTRRASPPAERAGGSGSPAPSLTGARGYLFRSGTGGGVAADFFTSSAVRALTFSCRAVRSVASWAACSLALLAASTAA